MNLDRLKYRYWQRTDWHDTNSPLEAVYCNAVDGCDPTIAVSDFEFCTGLKDKNGNLIYENDRVGFYVYGQDEEWHAQQGTVIWYNSRWGIETSSRFIQFENELTIKNPKDIEIIGNVHEQAEQGGTK